MIADAPRPDGPVRVVALTGIRSEWDLLQPVLAALRNEPDFAVSVIAAGAHLSPVHDHSVNQIVNDGFDIRATIENLSPDDSAAGKSTSAARLLLGLTDALDADDVDLLVVLGDREEALMGALAGTYLRIPVVHLAGGDHTHPVGGNLDEEIRHATTKLAHVHLTMAEAHSDRVRRLGEEPWRVHTVGSAGLDKLRTTPRLDVDALAELLGDGVRGDYAVVIHHPVHSDETAGAAEIDLILRHLVNAEIEAFVGAPNTDAGSHAISAAIERWADEPTVHVYRNLPRVPFVSLLAGAAVLVGNSSLGLHEAPYLGLPVVNVGERQRGRLAAGNVQWVDADDAALGDAVQRAVRDPSYRASLRAVDPLYGDGHTAEKVVAVLRSLPDRAALLDKNLTY